MSAYFSLGNPETYLLAKQMLGTIQVVRNLPTIRLEIIRQRSAF